MHQNLFHSKRTIRRCVTALAGLVILVGATSGVAGNVPDDETLLAAISAQRARIALQQDAESLNDLANLLVLSGDLADAEDSYRAALELDPDRIEVVYNLALLLQHDGRVREALKLFRHVIDLSPDAAWAHLQVGVISSDLGKRKSAVKAFQRAFELEPRLASRAVNPHVADRPEAVQALLEAGNDRPARSAPLSFAEPDRVARMLLADAAVTRAATRAAQNRGLLPEQTEATSEEEEADPNRAAAEKRKARRLEVESLPGERRRPLEPPTDSIAEPSLEDEALDMEDAEADAAAELQRFRDEDAEEDTAETAEPPVRRVIGVQDLREVRGAGASSSAAESSGNRRPADRSAAPSRGRGRPSASAPNQGGASRFRPGRRSSARLELQLGEEPVQVATSRWAPAPGTSEGR